MEVKLIETPKKRFDGIQTEDFFFFFANKYWLNGLVTASETTESRDAFPCINKGIVLQGLRGEKQKGLVSREQFVSPDSVCCWSCSSSSCWGRALEPALPSIPDGAQGPQESSFQWLSPQGRLKVLMGVRLSLGAIWIKMTRLPRRDISSRVPWQWASPAPECGLQRQNDLDFCSSLATCWLCKLKHIM